MRITISDKPVWKLTDILGKILQKLIKNPHVGNRLAIWNSFSANKNEDKKEIKVFYGKKETVEKLAEKDSTVIFRKKKMVWQEIEIPSFELRYDLWHPHLRSL